MMTEDSTTKKTPLLKNISKNLVVSGVMGILILTAALQALELNQMKGFAQGFLQGQKVKAATVAAPTAAPTATPVRPENTGGLPSQVGGC